MIRAGLHCAPTAHEIIGTKTTGTCRIGIGYFNEKKDIDFLIEALQKINK
jgi:selenocysteine lyase/cysteine desulfurase